MEEGRGRFCSVGEVVVVMARFEETIGVGVGNPRTNSLPRRS